MQSVKHIPQLSYTELCKQGWPFEMEAVLQRNKNPKAADQGNNAGMQKKLSLFEKRNIALGHW